MCYAGIKLLIRRVVYNDTKSLLDAELFWLFTFDGTPINFTFHTRLMVFGDKGTRV